MEIKRQEERSKIKTDIEACFEDATVALKRSDIIKLMQGKLGLGSSKSYNLFNQALAEGIIGSKDNRHYYLAVTEGNK